MEELENLLENITIPLAIWKFVEGDIICHYTNSKMEKLKKCMLLSEYIGIKKINYKFLYDTYIETKKKQRLKFRSETMFIEPIDSIYFYEIHYPNSFNMIHSLGTSIRKPLNNIIAVISIFERDNLGPECKKVLEIVKKSCFEIISIINDIIDVTKFEEKKIVLSKKKFSLEPLIEDVIRIFEDEAMRKNIQLLYNIDYNVPKVIYSNKERLEQMLVEMVKNAIKHTHEGIIKIEILLYTKDNATDYPFEQDNIIDSSTNLLFKIKDTGKGIDENIKVILDNLFGITEYDIFIAQQFNNFGLVICHYICELMGGKIWYKSNKDMGTIFYFNIVC
jgi:K+-sensing histidine kinase KdpD